jgi:hypothetical protein
MSEITNTFKRNAARTPPNPWEQNVKIKLKLKNIVEHFAP